jgi:hypothetical protein
MVNWCVINIKGDELTANYMNIGVISSYEINSQKDLSANGQKTKGSK